MHLRVELVGRGLCGGGGWLLPEPCLRLCCPALEKLFHPCAIGVVVAGVHVGVFFNSHGVHCFACLGWRNGFRAAFAVASCASEQEQEQERRKAEVFYFPHKPMLFRCSQVAGYEIAPFNRLTTFNPFFGCEALGLHRYKTCRCNWRGWRRKEWRSFSGHAWPGKQQVQHLFLLIPCRKALCSCF